MHDTSIPTQHTAMLTRTTRRIEESRFLMSESWHVAAASRRRVLRLPKLAGGSDDDHLRTTIRVRLADGTLPRINGRAWAGSGSGVNTCACCSEPIGRLDREFEPEAAGGLHAHGPCFTIWLAESLGLRVYDPHLDRRRERETAADS